ncbi:hypothetical protein LEN26_021302 [Aphanomyces euteiches]|nr:hypothetical protein LEN26_021302 [Aphanomyces euteiches]
MTLDTQAAQSVPKTATDALELLLLSTMAITVHNGAKTKEKRATVAKDDAPVDYRECQRQLAEFDLRFGSSSEAARKNERKHNDKFLRSTLGNTYSDVDACALDWCSGLDDIVQETWERAKLFKMLHNLRLTKLAIHSIDETFSKSCCNLERLDVSENSLTALKELPPSLQELDAYMNQLDKVGIHDCPALVHLGLGLNKLAQIPSVSHPERLLSLDLSFNVIEDLSATLTALRGLVNIKHLFLQGNPVVLSRGYRHGLLAAIPSLTVLDDIEINDKEKEAVQQTPLSTQNFAELTMDVDVVGLFKTDVVMYEATIELSPDLPNLSTTDAAGHPNVHFECSRVPLPISCTLRDSFQFRAFVLRVFEVIKSSSDADTESRKRDLRCSVIVDLSGLLTPQSLEQRMGELTVAQSFNIKVALPPIPPTVPPPKGAPPLAEPTYQEHDCQVHVKLVLNPFDTANGANQTAELPKVPSSSSTSNLKSPSSKTKS